MRTEREHYVTIIVTVIAMVVIVGGFASFSGLSVYEDPIRIELEKSVFKNGDVFDTSVVLNPVTFMADDSLMVYIDGKALGVVALKKYLDDNSIEYGSEIKNLGQNNAEILTLKNPLSINLADYVSLEFLHPGTTHVIKVEFSKGDAVAEEVFRVE